MVTQLYIQKLYKTLCEKILRLFSQKINVKKSILSQIRFSQTLDKNLDLSSPSTRNFII